MKQEEIEMSRFLTCEEDTIDCKIRSTQINQVKQDFLLLSVTCSLLLQMHVLTCAADTVGNSPTYKQLRHLHVLVLASKHKHTQTQISITEYRITVSEFPN